MIILKIIIWLILFFILLNCLYKITNHYKNKIKNIEKFKKGISSDLEIISIGSSYAKYAYDFTSCGKKGENLGIQPESLNYDFKILKKYAKNLKENAIVLINIPALVFSFVNYPGDNSNTKYYYFLDKKEINNYNIFKYVTRVIFPLLGNPKLIKYIFKDVKEDNSFNIEKNLYNEEQLEKLADIREKDWLNEAKSDSLKSDKVAEITQDNFKKITKILEEMIEFCIKNNYRPVIVIPPISDILYNRFSSIFLKKYMYNNIEIANKQKVPVLDYLNDKEFTSKELYQQIDFLNSERRKKFTNRVISDLKKINYW